MRGSAGGKARAILQKAEAQQRKLDYLQDPKICEFCRNPIPLNGNIPSIVRRGSSEIQTEFQNLQSY